MEIQRWIKPINELKGIAERKDIRLSKSNRRKQKKEVDREPREETRKL